MQVIDIISKMGKEFTENQRSAAENYGRKVALMSNHGHLIEPLLTWHDPEYEKLDWWEAYSKKIRNVSVTVWSAEITVYMHLGKQDEFGDAHEFIEAFEQNLIANDCDFIAEPRTESSKTRILKYKFNQNTEGADKFSIEIRVNGDHSEKCVIVEIPTGKMSEPKEIFESKVMCPGDPDYDTYVKKEEEEEEEEAKAAEEIAVADDEEIPY